MTNFKPTLEVTASGYIKAPDARPIEGAMRVKIETSGGGYRIVVCQDQPFNWNHKNYENTRGEALIHLELEDLEELAATILRIVAAERGTAP